MTTTEAINTVRDLLFIEGEDFLSDYEREAIAVLIETAEEFNSESTLYSGGTK